MLGLYVHIPFCARRCPYCDFAVVAGAQQSFVNEYVAALREEMRNTRRALRDSPAATRELTSIYFGGGTPSALDAEVLASLLLLIRDEFPLAADCEISLEANPEDATVEKFTLLRQVGWNRVSFGAQSFDAQELKFLGRRHDAAQIENAVVAARTAGLKNINLDLIYALPHQTRQSWQKTVQQIVGLGVPHVSCYDLTIEDGTNFGWRAARGVLRLAPDDEQAAMMQDAEAILSDAGFERYEISNYAQPGFASHHNLNYWRGGDYLACGCSAHGHLNGVRWWNERDAKKYVEMIHSAGNARTGEEVLTPRQRLDEGVLLGLRMQEGFNLCSLSQRLQLDVRQELNGKLDELLACGVLQARGETIRIAPQVIPVADAIVARLLV